MNQLKQYSQVRVRQLLHNPEYYDGWLMNLRPPQVGDTGCIIDILQAKGITNNYIVECSGKDGITIWLGDFLAEELEAIPE